MLHVLNHPHQFFATHRNSRKITTFGVTHRAFGGHRLCRVASDLCQNPLVVQSTVVEFMSAWCRNAVVFLRRMSAELELVSNSCRGVAESVLTMRAA